MGYESLVIPLKLMNEGKEVLVYSNRRDILKFCKFQKIPFIQGPIISSSKCARFPNKVKSLILKSLNGLDIQKHNIHVTHKAFGLHSLFMVFFAKETNVLFHKTEIDFEKSFSVPFFPFQNLKTNLKHIISFWFLQRFQFLLNYGLFITYRYYLGTLIPIVKDKWIVENTKIVDYNGKFEFFFDTYLNFSVNVPICKNLFLFTDINEMSNYVDKESLMKIHELIIGHDVTVKGHPNRNVKLDNVQQYPSFIPAEVLIAKTSNSVIGLSSTTLGYASFHEKIKSISFIDLVKWSDISKKNFFKDNLTKSGGKIVFPQTLQELDNLLR